MKHTQALLYRALVSLLISLTLVSCGGGGDSSSGDSGGTSTIFDGASACSAVGFKSRLKVVNGERCPRDGQGDTTSVVKVELFVSGFSSGTCTGTVISPTAVLTAAHCLRGAQRADIITTVNGQTARVGSRSLVVHPEFGVFSDQYYVNDVAIILTARSLAAPTTPILLSRSASNGEEAVVAGFGQTDPNGDATDDVYAGRAVIRSVSDNHIRIDFRSNEAHPCFGDSGGALFVKEGDGLAIVGVVSQSDPSVADDAACKVGEDKTLYTNIDKSAVSSFVLSVVPDAATR